MSKSKFVHFAPAFTSEGGGIFEVVNCLAYEQCKVHGASNVIVLGCSDKALAKVHSMPNDVVLDILPYKYSYVKFIQGFLKFKKILKDCDVLHVHGSMVATVLVLNPIHSIQ